MNRGEKYVNKEWQLLQNILCEILRLLCISILMRTTKVNQYKSQHVNKRYEGAKMLWLSKHVLAFMLTLSNTNMSFQG